MMMMMKGKGKGWGKGWGKGNGLSDFPAEKKVWVGGLAPTTTFRELQAHFATVGPTKFATIMKGKAAGSGGVAFATAEEATKAIERRTIQRLDGATIEVDVWTKKQQEEA